jgi:hypothetical protein
MDFIRKHTFTFWTIVILVILNILTLATIYIQQSRTKGFLPPPVGDAGRDRRGDTRRFLEQELNLTREQARQFHELRMEHFRLTGPMNEKISGLKKEIIIEIFKSSPDAEKVARLTGEIGALTVEMERFFSEHLKGLKSVCREDQLEKLQRLFFKILKPGHLPPRTRRDHPIRD